MKDSDVETHDGSSGEIPEPIVAVAYTANPVHQALFSLSWGRAISMACDICSTLGVPDFVMELALARLESGVASLPMGWHGSLDRAWIARMASAPETGDPVVQALEMVAATFERSDFGSMLEHHMCAAGIRPAQLARECSCSLSEIAKWLAHRDVTGMTRDDAYAIDRRLGSGGEIVAAHAVLSQQAAYAPQPAIAAMFTEGMTFGFYLRSLRDGAKISPSELAQQVQARFGLRLQTSALSYWERDCCVPDFTQERLIEAMDTLFGVGGALTRTWLEQGPRVVAASPDEVLDRLPPALEDEMNQLTTYARNRKTGKWNDSTVSMFREFCAGFYEFLVAEKGVPRDDLSIYMLCDWPLLAAFYASRQRRTGRVTYTSFEETRTRILLRLLRDYFPTLWQEAVIHPHWAHRLPTNVLRLGRHHSRVRLRSLSEGWDHVLGLARASARSFLRSNRFESLPHIHRASRMLGHSNALPLILKELADRVQTLPGRLLCSKAAVRCRQLALCGLLLARPMLTPRAIRRLRIDSLEITPDRRVRLRVPPKWLRNGRHGGRDGIDDFLPQGWAWLNEVLIRWVTEARPLLMAGPDDTRLFCSILRERKGGEAESESAETWMRDDVLGLLGINASAIRYLILADAKARKWSIHDMAILLQTTAGNVRRLLHHLQLAQQAARSNATVAELASGKSGGAR